MVLRRTNTRSLGDVISEFLKDSGLDRKLKEREIVSQWDEIVGKLIANSTQSIYVKDGKLFIHIRSAVIKNELNLIKQGLIQEINSRAGYKMVEEIVIR
jgi:predicted nucleic acid-binding Zn ribbon protein